MLENRQGPSNRQVSNSVIFSPPGMASLQAPNPAGIRSEPGDVKADKLKDAVRRWQQKSSSKASSSPREGETETGEPGGKGRLLSGESTRQVVTYAGGVSNIAAAVKAAVADGGVASGPVNFTGPLPFTEIMRLKKEGRTNSKPVTSRPQSPSPASSLEAGELPPEETTPQQPERKPAPPLSLSPVPAPPGAAPRASPRPATTIHSAPRVSVAKAPAKAPVSASSETVQTQAPKFPATAAAVSMSAPATMPAPMQASMPAPLPTPAPVPAPVTTTVSVPVPVPVPVTAPAALPAPVTATGSLLNTNSPNNVLAEMQAVKRGDAEAATMEESPMRSETPENHMTELDAPMNDVEPGLFPHIDEARVEEVASCVTGLTETSTVDDLELAIRKILAAIAV